MKIDWIHNGKATVLRVDAVPVTEIPGVAGCVDTLEDQGNGHLLLTRTSEAPTDEMTIEVRSLFAPRHTMIPAVLYDGNPWGSDHEYKGYALDGVPYTIAYHRVAVPSATCSQGDAYSLAVYARPGTSARLYPRDGAMVHAVVWPEQETPRTLLANGWGDPYYSSMPPQDQFTISIVLAGPGELAWQKMLDAAFIQNDINRQPAMADDQVWADGIAYAKTLYTEEPDGFCGFSIGLLPRGPGGEWIKRAEIPYEIGWCGQNASLALSLLEHHRRYGDPQALQMGLNVLDSWCGMARGPSGLLLTHYGDSAQETIDACNLGTVGVNWIAADALCQSMGINRPGYKQAAYDICAFIMDNIEADGRAGTSWRADGSVLSREGTAGAFLALPLLHAHRRFGEPQMLAAAARIFAHYYREFAEKGYGTSGALDTRCIDLESVIPLFKGALLLHELTDDAAYLEQAVQAAYYLSSWQWHYSTPFPPDTLLAQMRYDTFGATSVSTAHLHLDDYALCYAPELAELAKRTNHTLWSARARAIWVNALQGISDGTLALLGKPPRPRGSKDEGFLHTRWGVPGQDGGFGQYFSVSQWLVAWPCAFRLEVLRRGPST